MLRINHVTELLDLRLSLTFKLRLLVYSPLIHEYKSYTSQRTFIKSMKI